MSLTSMPRSAPPREVVFHDLECGAYAADLPLWRELGASAAGPVLDLGCGTGRVSLDLAAMGIEVTAVDRDPLLLDAILARRAGTSNPTVVLGDVTRLPERLGPFGLVLAPMQIVQLLNRAERGALLASLPRLLARGGVAAAAICETQEAVTDPSDPLPDPERAERDGEVFESHPIAVHRVSGGIEIERMRVHRSAGGTTAEQIRMDRLYDLTPPGLEEEAAVAGLRIGLRREIPPTADHVGSTVVVLEAP